MDHKWHAAVLHLCLNPAGLPVAHPGCPVDHIQTPVNQSPGDLWMRCIGSILFIFCYLAVGDEASARTRNTLPGMVKSVNEFSGSLSRKTISGLP